MAHKRKSRRSRTNRRSTRRRSRRSACAKSPRRRPCFRKSYAPGYKYMGMNVTEDGKVVKEYILRSSEC